MVLKLSNFDVCATTQTFACNQTSKNPAPQSERCQIASACHHHTDRFEKFWVNFGMSLLITEIHLYTTFKTFGRKLFLKLLKKPHSLRWTYLFQGRVGELILGNFKWTFVFLVYKLSCKQTKMCIHQAVILRYHWGFHFLLERWWRISSKSLQMHWTYQVLDVQFYK